MKYFILKKIKTWIIAVRPFAYTASFMPVLIGSALAKYYVNSFNIALFFITLVGVLSFHTAANLLNDYYDFKRGLDNKIFPTSGALVRGLLTPNHILKGAIICLYIGISCGFFLFFTKGFPILLFGLFGALISLFYTTKSFCLKYNAGLGDIAIFLGFGILPLYGTFYVQTETFALIPLFFGILAGLQSVAILHANNWHDIENDQKFNCKTFASILGENLSRKYYQFLIISPFILIILFCFIGFFINKIQPPYFILIVLLSFIPTIKLSKENYKKNLNQFAKLDMLTAKIHLKFNLLTLIGILISLKIKLF